MNRYICIHGHFYQPPRENPWLEEIELQDSAYPYHDWNELIAAECYAPNASSRILDQEKKIVGIVNNYGSISYNFGPTLLSWMERHDPECCKLVLEADRLSRERFSGHGSAIAQCYNHIIMPLSNRRDKVTQVKWGKEDFRRRFGRDPEGMWLPETAVDTETLEVLAEQGIRFTILSPFQAARVKKAGEEGWTNVKGGKIDPHWPYLCVLPSGKKINLFFYDGLISHDLGFGNLLQDGKGFAGRLIGAFSKRPKRPELVHVATDGETYGHHHRHGEMALTYCLHFIEREKLARITVYGEFLDMHPPTHEVEIIDQTAWSCAHGVGRWWTNCSCNTGQHPGWSQEWRTPLRNAMDWLRDSLAPVYEREMSPFMKDPWLARDDYISVILDRSRINIDEFLRVHAVRRLSREEETKVLRLLEMERHTLLMYTSCGWFFDDVSGIETVQTMQYASRAIQLAGQSCGIDLEPEYVRRLSEAKSNVAKLENGAKIYELFVNPARVDLLWVGIHHAISSIFESYSEKTSIYCYTAERVAYERLEAGRLKLAIGQTRVSSELLGDESRVSFAILHMGDHNLNGGGREFMGDEAFEAMRGELKDAFSKSDVPSVIRLMDRHFGMNNYSLKHLFRDEQRKVLELILEPSVREIESSLRQVYESFYPLMQAIRGTNYPMPRAFTVTGGYIANATLRNLLYDEESGVEDIVKVVADIKRFSFEVDGTLLAFVGSRRIGAMMERLGKNPGDLDLLKNLEGTMKILRELHLELNLWDSQNFYFDICRKIRTDMGAKADGGDEVSREWVDAFDRLGDTLHVRCL